MAEKEYCEHPAEFVEMGWCYTCASNVQIDPEIHDKLSGLGWFHGQTGGGCTAYTKNTNDPSSNGAPEGWYWLMTDSMDPMAPTKADQMVTVGLYNHDGMPVIDMTVRLSLILSGQLVFEDSY